MLRIYFVRHGETLWNTLKIFQGSSNSPLTEKGVEQAKKLGAFFEDINFDFVFSSTLERAIQTTNLILDKKEKNIVLLDELKEICMGKVEGIPREDFEKNFPEEYFNFWNNALEYNPIAYNGESYYELLKRVEKALKTIIKSSPSGNVLVVSHGVTLKAIFNIINKKDISEFSKQEVPENTSFTVVEYENDKFRIVDFSNTIHLK